MTVFCNGFGSNHTQMIEIISKLGLKANLKLCLDSGDVQSWPGSGQLWIDTSGQGSDVALGSNISVEATKDPTFNGTAGGLSSSQSAFLNGSQYFTLNVAANPAWANTLGFPNTSFSFAAWVNRGPNTTSSHTMFGTNGAGNRPGNNGIMVYLTSSSNGHGTILISNSTFGSGFTTANTLTPNTAANNWCFVGMSITNTVNTQFIWSVNGFAVTGNVGTVITSSVNPNAVLQIGAAGAGSNVIPAAARIGSFMIWQGTQLTANNFNAIFTQTRTRYGV